MNNTLKGMTMAGLAAVFWGSMGVAGQYLLQNCHFTPMDLISIRMLLAGSIFVREFPAVSYSRRQEAR